MVSILFSLPITPLCIFLAWIPALNSESHPSILSTGLPLLDTSTIWKVTDSKQNLPSWILQWTPQDTPKFWPCGCFSTQCWDYSGTIQELSCPGTIQTQSQADDWPGRLSRIQDLRLTILNWVKKGLKNIVLPGPEQKVLSREHTQRNNSGKKINNCKQRTTQGKEIGCSKEKKRNNVVSGDSWSSGPVAWRGQRSQRKSLAHLRLEFPGLFGIDLSQPDENKISTLPLSIEP